MQTAPVVLPGARTNPLIQNPEPSLRVGAPHVSASIRQMSMNDRCEQAGELASKSIAMTAAAHTTTLKTALVLADATTYTHAYIHTYIHTYTHTHTLGVWGEGWDAQRLSRTYVHTYMGEGWDAQQSVVSRHSKEKKHNHIISGESPRQSWRSKSQSRRQ